MALVRIPSLGNSRFFSQLAAHHLGNNPQVDASFYWKRLRRTAALAILLGVVNVLSGTSGSMRASTNSSRPASPQPIALRHADPEFQVGIHPDPISTLPATNLASVPATTMLARKTSKSDESNNLIEPNAPDGTTEEALISSGPRAVPPVGWRRTSNGWENVAEWPTAHNQTGGISAQVSLSDQILLQEKREPAVLRRSMDRLRSTHPAIIASVQIASVLVLFATWVAMREKPFRRDDGQTPNQLAS
jgi:hypothetical protein